MSVLIFLILIAGILLGLPIASAIGASAVLTNCIFHMELPMSTIAARCFSGIDNFSLMAIPFFILAGELMSTSGITRKVLDLAEALVGHLKGGLTYVNCIAAMLMASISGSGTASAAALGSTLIPDMERRGYGREYAVALTSCANVVGPIIPPSNLMILFSYYTGASIIKLFMGGIVPGILIGVSLMIVGSLICRKEGYRQEARKFSITKFLTTLKNTWVALLVPVFLFVSIITGLCTPTESGAIVCVLSLLLGIVTRAIRSWRDVFGALKRAASSTCMIFTLLAVSGIFSTVLIRTKFTDTVVRLLGNITSSGTVTLLLISAFIFVLGMFVDTLPMITMFSVPFAACAAAAGIDLVHLGVLMSYLCMVGAVTPPVGALLFVTCTIGNTTITKVIRMLIPMFVTLVIVAVILILIPDITLFLPDLLFAAG